MATLYYVHDPMCSWCYAFDKTLATLKFTLPSHVPLVKIVGGLAADSVEPMPKALVNMVQLNWKKIEQTVPHIKFNFDFWKNNQAIRSTYPSCRAVLAAKKQSIDYEDKMISQIQQAYYQSAENPSLDTTLIRCAEQIGLELPLFISDYKSEFINKLLFQQINFAKSIGVSSYPSLCLEVEQHIVLLQLDYINVEFISQQINSQLA